MPEGSDEALKIRSKGLAAASPAPARIRLLGPVDVVVGSQALPLGGRHPRTLLAALAVRAGQVLPTDALIDAIWGDHAPRTAPHALQCPDRPGN